ncbi:MAG: phosphoribosylglycinamide formyltransferase [Deltaproteobacteria bacterium]|nr:MAG: phosphoribosylglycinamide formyltransferase [Deltaproteobacteria bacterium]
MKLAVLASGSGTNLQALLDAEAAGRLAPGEIACVLCNRPGAGALDRARAAGKPALLVDHRDYPDRAAFERAMIAALDAHRVEGVVLAGFMRILTPVFVDRYRGRIVNTHPSLLPAFPGAHGARDALAYGVKLTGCTIHFVDDSLDGGPIIAQAAVDVRDDDTPETLQRRIQQREHELLPQVVQWLAAGRLRIDGRRVTVAAE